MLKFLKKKIALSALNICTIKKVVILISGITRTLQTRSKTERKKERKMSKRRQNLISKKLYSMIYMREKKQPGRKFFSPSENEIVFVEKVSNCVIFNWKIFYSESLNIIFDLRTYLSLSPLS